MHTGVSSSWVVWHVCLERYTRVLMEASLEFPIHFLKIYSTAAIVEAWRPAASKRAQHDRRVAVKGGAEHRWHREKNVPIDHPRVEGLAHLAAPVIDIDFGTA